MSDLIIKSDAAKFEQDVVQSPVPVVVDFSAEQCPPCEVLDPILERVVDQYRGTVRFVRMLRQENRELAERLNIKSSPTVLFYKGGQEMCPRLTGYISRHELNQAISQMLGDGCPKPQRRREHCDALVLGAGPAGLTAAIYLARARLKTVVIDEGLAGGQVLTTYHIANYPGSNGIIRGRDLMRNMAEQAMSFGVFIDDLKETLEIQLAGEEKFVKTEDTDYYARCVVLCTGAEPRRLAVEGEREYRGRGVHYCATCDGPLYQDKRLVVVGGGNSALQEAVYLTRFAAGVTVVHQLDHFQASRVAQEELFKNPNIQVLWDSQVRKIETDGAVQGVLLENPKSKETRAVAADGVFVYIGMLPRTGLFKDQVRLSDTGYVLTGENLQTNLEGVFAAGDVRAKEVRQIATAVGDGATAGLAAEKYITEKKVSVPVKV